MSVPDGWFVNPTERGVSIRARWQAREMERKYRAYMRQVEAGNLRPELARTRTVSDDGAGGIRATPNRLVEVTAGDD